MDNELIDALPGLDKAAILFQILGESLALTMFQDISESDILRIRVRSKELKNIPFKVKQSILEEFYFKLMTLKYRNINKDKKLFSFLDNLNDEQIYYLISTESAKVIALTLDQLSEDRKIKILNRFSNQVKHEIIMNFADLTDIPLEGIVNIAHELKKENFISSISKRIFTWRTKEHCNSIKSNVYFRSRSILRANCPR